VTDFGIARSGASQMTEVGSIIGTAQYLSPEQARGAPVDQRSDLYAVGVVLYEMLTGEVPFTGDTPLEIAMKHLSKVPKPPSELRSEVPHDLDLVVLRALAKDPSERYQSAEEMDADLARVSRGLGVTTETANAATAVLRGSGTTDATMVAPKPTVPVAHPPSGRPPSAYYGYDRPPKRRRPVWPWLIAVVLLAAAGVAAFFAYEKIQDQLNANKPIAVPSFVGQRQVLAEQNIRRIHLRPVVKKRAREDTTRGFVFDQSPEPGQHAQKNDPVTIWVSTGKPKVAVPDVRNKSRDDAVATLAAAGLAANPVEIFSSKPAGTVLAQDPQPGEKVLKGTKVRINVSRGLQQVTVPDVVGQPYANARGALLGAGFKVVRQDVQSGQQQGIVVSTSPGPGSQATQGSTVTVNISKGQPSVPVPDVRGQDPGTAKSLLEGAGFSVSTKTQPTSDPSNDGIVVSQSPSAGSKAPHGSTVTIVVGQFTTVPPPSSPPPPPLTP
jgi:serine/threonine-protein kinase